MELSEDTWQPHWPQGYKPNFRYSKPTFERHVGKSGKTWLIPAVTRYPNRADHLYVTAYADVTKAGTGFGGRKLVMPMIDGTDFELIGGWHSRSIDCLKDTGIDTTNQHLTYGAVGLHRVGDMWIFGLIYMDSKPKIGRFDRIELKAQEIANERGEPVVYGSLGLGGSVSGYMRPEGR